MGLSVRSWRYLVQGFFLLKSQREVLSEGYFLLFLACRAETHSPKGGEELLRTYLAGKVEQSEPVVLD